MGSSLFIISGDFLAMKIIRKPTEIKVCTLFKLNQLIHDIWLFIILCLFFGSFLADRRYSLLFIQMEPIFFQKNQLSSVKTQRYYNLKLAIVKKFVIRRWTDLVNDYNRAYFEKYIYKKAKCYWKSHDSRKKQRKLYKNHVNISPSQGRIASPNLSRDP
jgi:hypothetical protein